MIKLRKGEIIPLNFDYEFSGIFNDSNNLIIVENFIAIYLNVNIEKIRGHLIIKSRHLPINNKINKNKQVDLLLDLDGEKINIELSNKNSEEIKERNLVYASEIHGKRLKYQDNNYSKISKTLQICLNNFKCNKDKLVHTYYLKDENGEILSRNFQIDYVDLEKAKEKIYNENKLARFCRALNAITMEDFKKDIGGIMEKEAEEKLIEEVDKYSSDDEVIALYSAYSREELERNTLIEEAKKEATKQGLEQGLKQGLKQGLEQGIKQVVKKMLEEKFDIESICKATGLSKEEIEKIKANVE